MGYRNLLPAAALGALLLACGDEDGGAAAVRDQLNAIPGVTATLDGAQLDLVFQMPVDHGAPGTGTFPLHATLVHADVAAPLVVLTSGYFDFFGGTTVELTARLGANQVALEHRFFGASRPDLEADPSLWQYLTVRQAAADQHVVIAALRSIYGGAAISTGPSKGGMAALFHRRFYPDDVEATVAYVAPLSLGIPDPRYATFLDTVGPPACREALRALALELLTNRRGMLEAHAARQAAADGDTYARISLPAAVESSVTALEFLFWQYFGVEACDAVPAPSAPDADLWRFVAAVAPVSDSADAATAAFAPYAYQAYAELGFPALGGAHLAGELQFTDADYVGALPVATPPYDGGAAMRDIDAFVRTAPGLVVAYGEWDPWTAGAYTIDPVQSLRVTLPQGTHRMQLGDLPAAERDAVATRLEAWTGVDLTLPARAARTESRAIPPVLPRIPPAILRAYRAHGARRVGVSSTHE